MPRRRACGSQVIHHHLKRRQGFCHWLSAAKLRELKTGMTRRFSRTSNNSHKSLPLPCRRAKRRGPPYDQRRYHREFEHRQRELDRAWDVAEDVSHKAGNCFKNRNGEWVEPKPREPSMFEQIFEEITRMVRDGEIEGFHV